MIPRVSSILGFPEEKGTIRVGPELEGELWSPEASGGGGGWKEPSCAIATLAAVPDMDKNASSSRLSQIGGEKRRGSELSRGWRCDGMRHGGRPTRFKTRPVEEVDRGEPSELQYWTSFAVSLTVSVGIPVNNGSRPRQTRPRPLPTSPHNFYQSPPLPDTAATNRCYDSTTNTPPSSSPRRCSPTPHVRPRPTQDRVSAWMETLARAPSPPHRTHLFHQISVLLLTFSAYAAFHASRKPPSIVKSVLGPEVSFPDAPNATASAGWPPFDGPRGPHRLGELDLAFLSSYSAGMYFAGHAGDRVDLRRFLALGMLGSGVTTIAFGLGYWWDVHRLAFFLAVQIASGLFQSIGWPCVVAVLGNWFGKSKRGLIMGIWTSNTSVGNILGSVVASAVLEYGWGWSFVLPGVLIMVVGFVVLAFLVVSPKDLGFEPAASEIEMNENGEGNASVGNLEGGQGEDTTLLASEAPDLDPESAIGFLEAWRLPGVAPYACCLFFSKLVAYTFLYWLPFYIRHTAVAGKHLSNKTAGILSTIFDVGGVFGGITAGYISDKMGARAVTSLFFLFLSIPTLILYRVYGSISNTSNTVLMFLSGFFVNGPYSLITTAVAADLGTQDMIKGNSRALATVTAIIDGTGSVGAALGPLLTGYISTRGWNSVFVMLILATSLAGTFVIHIAKAEVASKIGERK
ncbi:hypothetical protein Taro_051898 [Colocasia esculenta]|uniref:Major facilitator superfamily (MFS) profile domain-containing protein n=1 Tax=Colocasia esculenta TaxID=4460 RepID=A0A843XIE1_COLES|nr:hypothetical protein [Colocasia esculenta]